MVNKFPAWDWTESFIVLRCLLGERVHKRKSGVSTDGAEIRVVIFSFIDEARLVQKKEINGLSSSSSFNLALSKLMKRRLRSYTRDSEVSDVVLSTWPLLERLPLLEFFSLCQTSKKCRAEGKAIRTDIARCVVEDEPPLPVRVLSRCACDGKIPETLRKACIECRRRLKSVTICAGHYYSLALLDNGDVFACSARLAGNRLKEPMVRCVNFLYM